MPRIIGTGPDCRGQYDAVKSAERMMWIGYASAGAFAAAGVTLLLLSPAPQPQSLASRCVPTIGATGGTAGSPARGASDVRVAWSVILVGADEVNPGTGTASEVASIATR